MSTLFRLTKYRCQNLIVDTKNIINLNFDFHNLESSLSLNLFSLFDLQLDKSIGVLL